MWQNLNSLNYFVFRQQPFRNLKRNLTSLSVIRVSSRHHIIHVNATRGSPATIGRHRHVLRSTDQHTARRSELQFGVPTTLSLTILAYLHAFNCYCVRNPRNPEKFNENSNLWSSRSSKVTDLGANRKPICDLLLVINSNFSRICYRFRDIYG